MAFLFLYFIQLYSLHLSIMSGTYVVYDFCHYYYTFPSHDVNYGDILFEIMKLLINFSYQTKYVEIYIHYRRLDGAFHL